MTRPSRRRFLRLAGLTTTASLAGCPDTESRGETQTQDVPTSTSSTGTMPTSTKVGASVDRESNTETATATPDSQAVVWQRSVGSSVVPTPGLIRGRVIAGTEDNTIRAFDVRSDSDVWTVDVDERIRHVATTDEVVVVVSGGNELRAGHTVHGFDPETGAERWTANPTDWYLDIVGARDGTVYVATEDDVANSGSETLYAISTASGATEWSGAIGEADRAAITADSVYVASYRHVDAFDAVTGEKRWRDTVTEDPARNPGSEGVSALDVDGQTVVYGYQPDDSDGEKVLVGVDAETDAERWRFESRSAVSSAVVRDDVVYADLDGVVALDADDGTVRWKDSSYGVVTPGGITENRIYTGGYDVHAYDRATGEIDWTWEPTPSRTGVYPAGVVSGTLLLDVSPEPAFRDRYKFGVDIESGEDRWVFTEGTGLTNLAVGETLAVTGGENGRLYALQ